jgi:hypothetical protein
MDFFLRTVKDNNSEFHIGKPDLFWGQGENDLIVDTNGDFATIVGVDNLNQSMAKIIVTERGANVFTPIYGSTLNGLIGTNLDIDFLRAKVKTDLIDTLRIYQFINKGNPNLDEQIDTLQSLKINQLNDGIDVSLTVITRSGRSTGSLVNIEG